MRVGKKKVLIYIITGITFMTDFETKFKLGSSDEKISKVAVDLIDKIKVAPNQKLLNEYVLEVKSILN